MKLITHLHLALRLRMSGAMPPPPINFHGMDRNYFNVDIDRDGEEEEAS
jgi:hypothetical protein